MDFALEIARFVTEAIGGIYIVNETTREIAFADAFVERRYGSALVGKRAVDVFRGKPGVSTHRSLAAKPRNGNASTGNARFSGACTTGCSTKTASSTRSAN